MYKVAENVTTGPLNKDLELFINCYGAYRILSRRLFL